MAYSDILTEEEYQTTKVNQEVIRYLEYTRKQLGLEKSKMNVLDWGCGRGNYTLYLREQGYSVYGVDISQEAIDRGKDLFRKKGYDPDELLIPITPSIKTAFPDNFFHFVFSKQVLEHVEKLDLVTKELARLTKPGGFGFHVYPGDKRPIEGHLFMPFVHWLPKNFLRDFAIRFFVAIGVEPHWSETNGLSVTKKAKRYTDYSKECTFYRPSKEVFANFRNNGFSVKPVAIDHPKLQKISWAPRAFIESMVLRFWAVEILVQK